jgi:hypothetical protein
MKLFELAAKTPSQQAAKVYESYYSDSFKVDRMGTKQVKGMLSRVRGLINEHRQTPEFHSSERNPSYLKLIMMERALSARLVETSTVAVGTAAGATATAAQSNSKIAPVNPAVAAGDQAAKQKRQAQINTISDPKVKAAFQKTQNGQTLTSQEQQLIAAQALPMGESRRRLRVNESEIQQAQVVLASQDMVDQIQKMVEQVSAMQFKDLPALVDQIKNQVGVDQAGQFNTDATTALGTLVQNLQAARQQMDQALGVVTGQATPVVPGQEGGEDLGAAMGDVGDADAFGGEEIAAPDGDEEVDAFAAVADEEPAGPEAASSDLGRKRR